MAEIGWALLLLLVLGAITAARWFGWSELVELGQTLMLRSSGVGIPLELVYFTLLAITIRKHSACPKGWYWRSFEHHHLLTATQRRYVLPFFYLGALAFLGIAIGIGMVLLGAISALQQG
jgi:hypothetical protein